MIAKSVHCVRSTCKRDIEIVTGACVIKVRVADRRKVIGESVGQKIFCVFEHENGCLKFVDIRECECVQVSKQGRGMVTTMRHRSDTDSPFLD